MNAKVNGFKLFRDCWKQTLLPKIGNEIFPIFHKSYQRFFLEKTWIETCGVWLELKKSVSAAGVGPSNPDSRSNWACGDVWDWRGKMPPEDGGGAIGGAVVATEMKNE